MDTDDFVSGFSCGIFISIVLGIILSLIISLFLTQPVNLSQESADAICYNLTSTEGVKGLSEHNKLVCEVPSFDSTPEIIVRTNGERK